MQVIAPSDMMDGRVGAIKHALREVRASLQSPAIAQCGHQMAETPMNIPLQVTLLSSS